MYDLFLTKNGDLCFTTINSTSQPETFEYNFHVAESDSLLYKFSILNFEKQKTVSNKLDFNFYVYKPKYNKSAKLVTDDVFINQAIKMRLSTELGTVRGFEDLGSEIYTLMHSNIPTDKLKSHIIGMVKNALADILPNASIEVTFLNTDYLNYHDSIQIVIINNEELYYYTI